MRLISPSGQFLSSLLVVLVCVEDIGNGTISLLLCFFFFFNLLSRNMLFCRNDETNPSGDGTSTASDLQIQNEVFNEIIARAANGRLRVLFAPNNTLTQKIVKKARECILMMEANRLLCSVEL